MLRSPNFALWPQLHPTGSLYQLTLSSSSSICNWPGYYAGKGIEWVVKKGLISSQNATQFRKPGAVLSGFRMAPDTKNLHNSNYPTSTPTTTAGMTT